MKRFFKASVYILTAVITVVSSAGFKMTANAASLSNTVSLLNPQTNEGSLEKYGYYWDNINDILTIEDLNIKTDDDYGLKIKDGATVVLKGNSTIEAEKAALYLSGSISPRGITFQGKGTLTLISENGIGILDTSSNKNATVRITSGTINIRSGSDGINSKYAYIALTGGNISIESGKDTCAINAREITINGGCRLTANAPLLSSSISISSAYLDIASEKPALQADSIDIVRVDIKTGASRDSLQDKETYNGENAITTKTNFFLKTQSLIFGKDHTIAADILVLVAMIAVVAIVIIIPVAIKKKKAKRIIAAKQAEEEARLKEAKAKKKAASKKQSRSSQNSGDNDSSKNETSASSSEEGK